MQFQRQTGLVRSGLSHGELGVKQAQRIADKLQMRLVQLAAMINMVE